MAKTDNIRVEIDRDNCDFKCYADKEVVETADDVMDPMLEISLDDAKKISKKAKVGDMVSVSLKLQGVWTHCPHRMPRTLFFRRSARKSAAPSIMSTLRRSTTL
nr:NusA N-terminal domain-containing protein [Butyrivibrio sp. FCS014]